MNRTLFGSVGLGALAGIGAGIVMGIAMQMLAPSMFPQIASMVCSTSPITGWALHEIISAIFGGVFGALVFLTGRQPLYVGLAMALGEWLLVWIVLPLVLTPMVAPEVHLDPVALLTSFDQIVSVVGHVVYGGVTAIAYGALVSAQSRVATAEEDDEDYEDDEEEYEEDEE